METPWTLDNGHKELGGGGGGGGLYRVLFSNSPDIRAIFFQISTNQLRSSEILPSIRNEVLILTENETEKDRWVATLEELHKAAKQSTSQLVSI